ncbi:MAG: substrate-binding domain-containing protein [Ardenticatenaceae bacterium]|nr:substrate-binding domain-containing protein [Ardenticatenaceae bacterium]MCB8990129.1 substrate-binding domain-containing protein [Ardenticatenaceae bacterium]
MKRRDLLTFLSLFVILALFLVACGGQEPAEEPTEVPAAEEATAEEPAVEEPAVEEPAAMEGVTCEEPVKVGLITDETGALAIYGAHILRSFPLGLEYATGAPGVDNGDYTSYMLDNCEIQLYTRDDQSTPENTATVGRELIEVVDVDVLVGTVSSGATATLQELARENQVPLIVAPAAANDITGVNFNEYTFRTSRNNYQDAVNLCEYLTTQYDTFVQIAPDYAFGYGGATAFRDACTLFGGEFVVDDIFAPLDTTEFTPYMEQILDSGADAWLVTWAGGGFIPMINTASELGVLDAMELGASFVDNVALPAFFANAIGSTSGILYHYTLPDNEINDWLVAEVNARFDTYPDLFDADAMNAALLLTEALKKTGGDASADALIGAMEGAQFEGPKGTIYIRPEDHVAIQDMYIAKLLNVDDPEFKYFEYVKTTRPNVPCLLPEGMQDRCGDLPIGALGDISQVTAVEPEPEPEPAMTATCDEPIKIGLVTDATGALAIYGAHILRSFPLGLEYASGAAGEQVADDQWNFMVDNCPVEVYIKDDQSTPENTATVGRELIEVNDVDILVGTVSSGATATLQELARENEVVLVVAPAAANDMTGVNFNEYTFRTSRNNYQDAVNLCAYLVTQYDTFVQIAPDYAFGYGGAAAFRDACTLYGGEFVADDIFAPLDTTEFTPYMEQILDSGADAWLVTWAGGGFIPMINTANELGVLDELGMGASFVDNIALPAFFASAIGSTSGILYHYTLPDNEVNDWLVAEVNARFDTYPDLFDADAMNAGILIVNALRATGGDASADALIAAMEGMEFEGPKGTIYIRPEDHVAVQDMYIATLLNVDDPEFKFFEYVDTTRPDVPCLLPEDLVDRCGDLPVGSLSGE